MFASVGLEYDIVEKCCRRHWTLLYRLVILGKQDHAPMPFFELFVDGNEGVKPCQSTYDFHEQFQ